jgi:hypothetical protein
LILDINLRRIAPGENRCKVEHFRSGEKLFDGVVLVAGVVKEYAQPFRGGMSAGELVDVVALVLRLVKGFTDVVP